MASKFYFNVRLSNIAVILRKMFLSQQYFDERIGLRESYYLSMPNFMCLGIYYRCKEPSFKDWAFTCPKSTDIMLKVERFAISYL